jgi:hypothetical protein
VAIKQTDSKVEKPSALEEFVKNRKSNVLATAKKIENVLLKRARAEQQKRNRSG